MTPPLAALPRDGAGAGADPAVDASRRDPPCVRAFGLALLAVGVGLTVGLVLAGAPLPHAGPVVLLVALLAFCVNRYTFFPSELAVTAEAAVVIAAVVWCSTDAPLLGPVLVALAVGPVDMVHWEQRAFTRMAHNAGDRALAAVAAALAYAAVSGAVADPVLATALAVPAATLAFAAVEVVLSTALLRLLSADRWWPTVRHAAGLEALTLPLGVIGGLAGVLAREQRWWLALAVLAPLPWVPELVARRRAHRRDPGHAARRARTRAAGFAAGAVTLVLAALATSPPGRRLEVLVLCVAAGALGIELGVDRDRPVAPLAALALLPVVVAPVVPSPGFSIVRGAAIAALVVGAGAMAETGRPVRRGLLVALVAGAAAAAFGHGAAPAGPLAAVWCGVGAAAVFVVVAVLSARHRRRAAADLVWSVPIVAAAALVAAATPRHPLGSVAGVALVLVVVARAGLPPWRSRWLSVLGGVHPRRGGPVAITAVVGVAALALAVVALLLDGGARGTTALVAGGTAELALAVGAAAARQWTFAPVARGRRALGSIAAGLGVIALYVPLARLGSAWSIPVMSALLVWALLLVARCRRRGVHAQPRVPVRTIDH